MECWLVRHGESTWNSERRFQGTLDAPLSARGRAQASARGARLGLEAVLLDELREISLGDWEGLTLEAVQAREGEYYRRWLEAPVDHPAPGGEPMPGLATRVRAALDRLCAVHPEG